MSSAAESLYRISRLELGGLTEALDNSNHGFTIQDSGDVMGDGGTHFTFPARHEVTEQSEGQLASNGGKGVAIEEEERRLAMKRAKPIECFG
jgi:hypothetical protein